MASYDQQNSSSTALSPWPLLETEFPDDDEGQGLHNPSSLASPLSSSSKPSPTSSFSSKGGSVTRISKRKSRAKPKPPVKELSASKLNFRDIVHHFTGSESNNAPSLFQISSARMPSVAQNYDATSVRCLPTAVAPLSQKDAMLASACIAQSLRTLETISAYLLRPLSDNQRPEDMNMYCEGNKAREDRHPACNERDIESSSRPAADLEKFLPKGNNKLDNFFSLSCLVLNQIASQCGVLQPGLK